MSYAQLFCVLLLYYCVYDSYGQGDCEIGNKIGIVFEYAEHGFEVINLDYSGNSSDIIIELQGNLNEYFRVEDEVLIVGGQNNITRDINFDNAQILCSTSPDDAAVPDELFITIRKINNLNEVKFDEAVYSQDVDETSEVGSFVFTVAATDLDVPDTTITYEIVSQDPPDFFEVSESSNTGRLRLLKPLDFNAHEEHRLEIKAISTGFNNEGNELIQTTSTEVIFTVIDGNTLPPQFQPCEPPGDNNCVSPLYRAEVTAEDVGTVEVQPGAIEAVDGDKGINSPISYSFVRGDPPSYNDYFSIDPNSGVVSKSKAVADADGITRFSIAVQANETEGGKTTVTYLAIEVVVADESPPVFGEFPPTGYISQSSYDNKVLSMVTEDREGTKPFKLIVTDADDDEAKFAFDITEPYLVSNDGTVYFSPTSTGTFEMEEITVKAINLGAELNSPNRISPPATITIETAEEPTTPESTTTQPETTEAPTTQATTLESTTAEEPETTMPFTCPPVTTPEPCPTVATTEACPTCVCTEGTTTISFEETTMPVTCPQDTTPESCPTVEPCPNVTTVEPSPMATTEACPTIEPCPTLSTVEPCPTVTTDACPTCSCEDSTTSTSKGNPTASTVIDPTCPTCPVCTESSTVEGDSSTKIPDCATCPTCPTIPESASCPTCPTSTCASTIQTTGGNLPPPVGYFAEEVLYGVAGGLSGGLLICIIIIIVLLVTRGSKKHDVEKNELLEKDSISRSFEESRHVNPTFETDVDDEISRHNDAIQPTSFSNIYDTKIETSLPDDDSGTEVNGYEEKDSVEEIAPPPLPAPYVPTPEPEEEEQELSGFASEIKKGAAAIAAAAVVTAAVVDDDDDKDESKDIKAVPAVVAAAVVVDDGIIQDYESAYKNSQITVEKILKDGGYAQTQLVTIPKYGIDREDTKSVVKTLKLSQASFMETSSMQAQIRLVKKACEQDHENILQFCGSYEDENELHCALMYAPNGNMLSYLRADSGQPRLEPFQMIDIISGIGKGLQYLHAKNIVHCHLQSRCVMLDENLIPKIRDFENNEVSAIKVGDDRKRWQAVEVLNGDLSTQASDVWSFGVVMWEVASRGMTPYANISDDDVKRHLDDNNRLQKPLGCSDSLFAIIESCWNTDPRFRPDMYVLVSNLAEKATDDADELIGMDVSGSTKDDISPTDVSISIAPNQPLVREDEEFTMF